MSEMRRFRIKCWKKRIGKLNKSNFPVSKLFFPDSPSTIKQPTEKRRKGINEKDKKRTRSFLIKSDLWGDAIDGDEENESRQLS